MSNGPWDSEGFGGAPETTPPAGKKYLHYILVGGGGLGSMTVPSDYDGTTGTSTSYLSLTGSWDGAYGGASGGYQEAYIDVTGVTNIAFTSVTNLQGGKRNAPGNPDLTATAGKSVSITFTKGGVKNYAAGPGYPSSLDPTIVNAPASVYKNDDLSTPDGVTKIVVSNINPVPAIGNYCGSNGYLCPDGVVHGSGASQDDSTPATDGYWWYEFTDVGPANYAYISIPPTPPAIPVVTPIGETNDNIPALSANQTHILITLVAPGSVDGPGDAIVNFPLLITGYAGRSINFASYMKKVVFTLRTGNTPSTPVDKVITMWASGEGVSINEFIPNDTTSYKVTDQNGTYVSSNSAYYGKVGAFNHTQADTSTYPCYSYSFATITSFDSFRFPVAGVNYPTNPKAGPYVHYDYIHATLIGGGGSGYWGPGGGQGALVDFYFKTATVNPTAISFDLDPNTWGINDAIFTAGSYKVTAQGGIGQNTGGSVVIAGNKTNYVVNANIEGSPSIGSMPGGFSPMWQQLYLQAIPTLEPATFAECTPYTDYPDKGNMYQCYGSGGQSNASFYTSSGPGAAYWKFEFVPELPPVAATSTDASFPQNITTQNPGTLTNTVYIGASTPGGPTGASVKTGTSPSKPLSIPADLRFLHYIIIGPGDAGNGAYCGGAGGYIEAYVDLGPSGTGKSNIVIIFNQGLASQAVATTDSSLSIWYTNGLTNKAIGDTSGSTPSLDDGGFYLTTSIALGSKGLQGAVQTPADQFTMIIKSLQGRAGTVTQRGPGYYGKDDKVYGAGGSRGSGGTTAAVAGTGYFWFEFTNTRPTKTSWNNNEDTLTYPPGTSFFDEYRFLHYVLIGGGTFSAGGGCGGPGGAYIEAYVDLNATAVGDNHSLRNGFVTFGTGEYDIGDGRGPSDNSYFQFQDLSGTNIYRPTLSIAIAEGGTSMAYALGGMAYLKEFDSNLNDISGAPYTTPQRMLYGQDPPFPSSKPANGYMGKDFFTYGDGGQEYGPYKQEATGSYWWFEYTNELPAPSGSKGNTLLVPLTSGVNSGTIPVQGTLKNYRYIHYIVIGAGSSSGNGGSLVEGYFDQQTAIAQRAAYPGMLTHFKFQSGAASTGATANDTEFRYAGNGGDIGPNPWTAIVAGGATDLSGGIPIGFNDPYTFVTRVFRGANVVLNPDGSVAIPAPGFAGTDGAIYGSGGTGTSGTGETGGYFWYEFTNKTPKAPYVPPKPKLKNPNFVLNTAFGDGTTAPPAYDLIVPFKWEDDPVFIPLPPIEPMPLNTYWSSNLNQYSYPTTTENINNKYLHFILIGAGSPGTATMNGDSGAYIEGFIDLKAAAADAATPAQAWTAIGTYIDEFGTPTLSFYNAFNDFVSVNGKVVTLPTSPYSYVSKFVEANMGTEMEAGAGFVAMDGVTYGSGGGIGGSFAPRSAYWGLEFTDFIPVPPPLDSNTATPFKTNDGSLYLSNPDFFKKDYRYFHYVLIGGGGTPPATAEAIGGASGALIEGYLDLETLEKEATGNTKAGLGFVVTPAGDASFIFLNKQDGTTIVGAVAAAPQQYYMGGVPIVNPASYTVRQNKGYNAQNIALTQSTAPGFIGPDGRAHGQGGNTYGAFAQPTSPAYWWYEYTNGPLPPLPASPLITTSTTTQMPGTTTSTTLAPTTTTTTTTALPNNLATQDSTSNTAASAKIKIRDNPYRYLHYEIVAAGSNGTQTGGAGAVLEVYVDLNSIAEFVPSINQEFNITFVKGKASGDGTSTFTLSDKENNAITSSQVATGDATNGGTPSPPGDPFSYAIISKMGAFPGSNWSPSNPMGTGGYGHPAPYSGVSYGAGGNADGRGSAAEDGYWIYELTNKGPPTAWDSVFGPSNYPKTLGFFREYSHLHYILVGGGDFGTNAVGGGAGGYIEGYLNLEQAGKNGIVDFSIYPSAGLGGANSVFTYTNPVNTEYPVSSAVARGGGNGVMDISGGGFTQPTDLFTYITNKMEGSDGIEVTGGTAPLAAGGYRVYDSRFGYGGTNYNNLDGGQYPGPAYWWFELVKPIVPPPSLIFDSNTGTYPSDLTPYINNRYLRYVLIGAGSKAGGSGSLLDVYIDLDKAGREKIMTLVQGNIWGPGVDTTFKFGGASSALAGGASSWKGGIPVPPTDVYSYVNKSQYGQDVSGGESVLHGSTIGFQGLDGVYYGQGGEFASGLGYWSIEFTNRAPTVNAIIDVFTPSSMAPPSTTTPPTTTTTIGPGPTTTTTTTQAPIGTAVSNPLIVTIPKTTEGGVLGPFSIQPIIIPESDLSGASIDLSGGLTALISYTITSSSGPDGKLIPTVRSGVIETFLSRDTSGPFPVYKSPVTTDPWNSLLKPTDTLVYSAVIKSTNTSTEISNVPTSKPAQLEAGILPEIPIPKTKNGVPGGATIKGTPSISVKGDGITGVVKVLLNAELSLPPALEKNHATAPISGDMNVYLTIDNDPVTYKYTLPLVSKKTSTGYSLGVDGSSNLNNAKITNEGVTEPFAHSILLDLSGSAPLIPTANTNDILSYVNNWATFSTAPNYPVLGWELSEYFTPVPPEQGYYPPGWNDGDLYGIYATTNTAVKKATDFVYDPNTFLTSTMLPMYEFSGEKAPLSNLSYVVAATPDGITFIYSNVIFTGKNSDTPSTSSINGFEWLHINGNPSVGYRLTKQGTATILTKGDVTSPWTGDWRLWGTTNHEQIDLGHYGGSENLTSFGFPPYPTQAGLPGDRYQIPRFQVATVDSPTNFNLKMMAFPLLVVAQSFVKTGLGSVPTVDWRDLHSDPLLSETGLTISEPKDGKGKIKIEVFPGFPILYKSEVISVSNQSSWPRVPVGYNWAGGTETKLYGVFLSTDCSLSSEQIVADLKNLVSAQDQDTYQLPNAVGKKYASKILVGAWNGEIYCKPDYKDLCASTFPGALKFPLYSNYIILDTGVDAGYDKQSNQLLYSSVFTPTPIPYRLGGDKYDYLVYYTADQTLTVSQIIADAVSVTNVGANQKVFVSGTNFTSMFFGSATPTSKIKAVIAASEDGSNICYSRPVIFKPTNTSLSGEIFYDAGLQTINIPDYLGSVLYTDANAEAAAAGQTPPVPGPGPILNAIYISTTKDTPANILANAANYFDFVPVGSSNYTFRQGKLPSTFPCYIVVSYATIVAPATTPTPSALSGNYICLTAIDSEPTYLSSLSALERVERERPKALDSNISLPKRGAKPRRFDAAGSSGKKIGLGSKLSITSFDMAVGNNGPKYGLKLPKPLTYFAACLLKGTEVLTNNGYIKIEDLKVGDYVISHRNKAVKILSLGVWRVEWTDNIAISDVVFKVKTGVLGATKPLFISAHHQMLVDGALINANCAGLPLAKKEEICEQDGFYTFFNVKVENHELNHLIVNGGVIVESWDGKYPHETKDAPLLKNPYALTV